ncbi:hypothetical protein BDF14DRAFT_265460 [Spinellus fusiger]|nr:hypothetical protein BDF14DRAFT_265460 [Spinellus fusiger]
MVKQPPSRRVDHSLSNFFTLAKPSLAKPGSVDPPDVWYYIEPGQPTDTLDSTNPVSMEHDEDELPWDLVLQSGQIMAAAKDWSFKCLADPQPQDAPKIVSLSKRKHPNDALEAMAKSSKKVCPDKPELKKDAPKGIRAAQGTTLVQKTTPTTPATDIKSRVGFCVSNSVKLGEKTPLVVKEVDSGPRLSPEQEKVLHRAVYSEHSLFFTGPAGKWKREVCK